MSDLEVSVSREMLVPARLIWPEHADDERLVSLRQADAAAVRVARRLEDGRKVGAMVVFRSPLSHEADWLLVALAKPHLERNIEEVVA